MSEYDGYTERDWEKVVGWGKLPKEYEMKRAKKIAENKGIDLLRKQNPEKPTKSHDSP